MSDWSTWIPLSFTLLQAMIYRRGELAEDEPAQLIHESGK